MQANSQKKNLGVDNRDKETLPQIPRATLTGMRTFIHAQTHSTEMIMRTEQTRENRYSQSIAHEENLEETKMDRLISTQNDEVGGFSKYFIRACKTLQGVADEYKLGIGERVGTSIAKLCLA